MHTYIYICIYIYIYVYIYIIYDLTSPFGHVFTRVSLWLMFKSTASFQAALDKMHVPFFGLRPVVFREDSRFGGPVLFLLGTSQHEGSLKLVLFLLFSLPNHRNGLKFVRSLHGTCSLTCLSLLLGFWRGLGAAFREGSRGFLGC